MKTRINLITRKSLLKTLSGILCAALTMQLGWGLADNRTQAAETTSVGLYTQELPGFSEDYPIYAGDDYDFMGGVYTDPMGYEGYVTFEYANANSNSYSDTKPKSAGTYKVRAVLPSSSQWDGSTSEAYTYTIKDRNALSLSEVSASGNYYTIEGTYQCQWGTLYVNTVRVIPVTGFLIACPTVGDDKFAEYLDVDPEQMTDAQFRYKRIRDGKTTDYTSAGDFSYLVPDEAPPQIENYSRLDGKNVTIHDGDTFYGDELQIIIYDHHLYQYKINGEMIFEQKSDSFSNVTSAFVYSEPGVTKEINIYILDYAYRTCEATVYLVGAPLPNLDVTIPAPVYVGDNYNIGVKTDSDGEVIIQYRDSSDDDAEYTEIKPTSAGTYDVEVTVSKTSNYKDITLVDTLIISKRDANTTVTVPDVFIGDSFTPKVTTSSDGDYYLLYKNDDMPDSEFTETKPTAIGNYTVMAIVEETNTYLEDSATDTFSIKKRTDEPTISISDTYVGDPYEPVITTKSNGLVTLTFKNNDVENSAFTSKKPTAAGNYTVKAVIAETDTYNELTCYDTFTISKRDATASVTVPDTFVGDSYVPKVVTVSNGTQSFLYKNEDIPDSEFTAEKPTAAGNYTVMAIIAESDAYNEITCTSSFSIIKRNDAAIVSISDSFVGDSYEPKVTTKSTGSVTYTYRNDDIEESAFTATKPTAAGNYTVKAVIAETDVYKEVICYDTFAIKKRSAVATVSVEDIFVGGTVKPVVTTESDGKGDATFEYKAVNAADTEYSNTIPTTAGTYSVRATIPATAKYLGITCSSEFTINLNKPSVMNLTVKDIYYGQTVSPTFETDSDGSVTIMYKLSTAPDSAYSTVAPTTTGKYTARATVSETAVYEGAACYKEFSISYLEAPQVAYTPTGKAGNDGYFTSDVQLAAPEGYTISSTSNGEFTKSIPYTEGMNTIYLKRDDGARTAAITITDKPRIDKVAPAIASSTGAIATGSIIYSSDMNITVSDTHLKSLKVNGEDIELKSGTSNVITLNPGYGIKSFVITAEDIAGNVTTIEITLKAEWLENKIILPNVSLPLFSEESYTLDNGQWIVTKNTTSDTVKDNTVYNGDLPFYVNEDGDYTFTKVT